VVFLLKLQLLVELFCPLRVCLDLFLHDLNLVVEQLIFLLEF